MHSTTDKDIHRKGGKTDKRRLIAAWGNGNGQKDAVLKTAGNKDTYAYRTSCFFLCCSRCLKNRRQVAANSTEFVNSQIEITWMI